MDETKPEPTPDDTMRMLLTTFAGTAEQQVDKFRARAREFHEEADSHAKRSADRHELAREYEKAADLLEAYRDAGHRAATALMAELDGSEDKESPGMSMARMVRDETKGRLF